MAALEHIELSDPLWLWLIVPFSLITVAILLVGEKHDASDIATASTSGRQRFKHTLIALLPATVAKSKLNYVSIVIYVLVFLLLIIALCEPVRVGSKLPDPPRERDIVFIIDTSISMTLQDYLFENKPVQRITVLKAVIDRFVQNLKGERIAVIVFGDHAHTLVPMTSDQHLLRRMIARIEATMAGRFNAIGEGISLALATAKMEPTRRQILILVTDADSTTGGIDPNAATRLIAQAKLPLYTIAVGATNYSGKEKTHGGLIYEPVNLALLQSLSGMTGARNYMASDSASLENAISEIAQFETYARHVEPRFYRDSFYFWPLLLALALITCLQFSHLLLRIGR